MRATSSTRCGPSSGSPRPAALLVLVLGHAQLLTGVHGHLGEVRHAQHLVMPPQRLQQLSHHLGDTATDAGIDLIEDERRDGSLS
jgi:hypothetical protein